MGTTAVLTSSPGASMRVLTLGVVLLLLGAPAGTSPGSSYGEACAYPALCAKAGHVPCDVRAAVERYTSELNPLLRCAIELNNVTRFSADIVKLLTGVVGVLRDAPLATRSPIRPDLEASLYGYRTERHSVTTHDGYILGVFRVHSSACRGKFRAVVVLTDAMFANAGTFFLIGRQSLAYRLADRCYDVWVLSFRGGLYGRNHTTRSLTSEEFWDFNPYQWGAIDLPEQLAFVRERTRSRCLHLLGVDITGTAFFFMNDAHGDKFQDHFASAHLLLPIGFMAQPRSLGYNLLRDNPNLLTMIGAVTDYGEMALFRPVSQKVLQNLCILSPVTCKYFFEILDGPSDQINTPFLANVFRNVWDSTSIQAFNWPSQQNGQVKRMAYYDFGSAAANKERYGTPTPPLVDLRKTKRPCSVYAMANSTAVAEEDIRDTYEALAASARRDYHVFPYYSAVGPGFPLHTEALFGKVIAGIERDIALCPAA